MRKYILPLLLLSLSVNAQDGFKFEKKVIESEDKWVIFPTKESNRYTLGFVYIDLQAGLTFDLHGWFVIDKNGKYKMDFSDTSLYHMVAEGSNKLLRKGSYKMRLQPDTRLVAWLPEEKNEELEIPKTPDWLSIYKGDTTSTYRLYRMGFQYNHWNEFEKALGYLLRAQKQEPKFKGLATELGFTYNALERYQEAISILEGAYKYEELGCYFYKEYVYALMNLEQLVKAGTVCEEAFKKCEGDDLKAEMAYNMAHSYYLKKDAGGFKTWRKAFLKYSDEKSPYLENMLIMQKQLGLSD